eukprot:UN06078
MEQMEKLKLEIMQFFMDNAAGNTLDNVEANIGLKTCLQEKCFFFCTMQNSQDHKETDDW